MVYDQKLKKEKTRTILYIPLEKLCPCLHAKSKSNIFSFCQENEQGKRVKVTRLDLLYYLERNVYNFDNKSI